MVSDRSLEHLTDTLNILFEQAIDVLSTIGLDGDHLQVYIPTGSEMEEMDTSQLASIVAESSNIYSKVARLAGIAKAEYNRAQRAYKNAYKANKYGKNEDERDKAAIAATEQESKRLDAAETVYNLAEGVESAARVASETARKLLDKIESVQIAEGRERYGQGKVTKSTPRESIDF